jgi:hypothetical protein
MSVNDCEGRVHESGQYMSQPDFWVDMAVRLPSGMWSGFEINGAEHDHDVLCKQRDWKQQQAVRRLALPVQHLRLAAKQQPDEAQWRAQLQRYAP